MVEGLDGHLLDAEVTYEQMQEEIDRNVQAKQRKARCLKRLLDEGLQLAQGVAAAANFFLAFYIPDLNCVANWPFWLLTTLILEMDWSCRCQLSHRAKYRERVVHDRGVLRGRVAPLGP